MSHCIFCGTTGYTFQYEGCSNMNASSFITLGTYMLQQNSIRFYKGLYITFKLAEGLKKNTVHLLNYSPLMRVALVYLQTQCFEHITVIKTSV